MTINSGKLRLRTAGAILALLLGWFSAPLSLAAYEPDVCSMACCVESGYCCCAARHGQVEGQLPSELAEIIAPQIFSPCPSGCATPAISSQVFSRHAPRAGSHDLNFAAPREPLPGEIVRLSNSLRLGSSSPRAPPLFPLVF
jgi:hypothetical protein